MKTHYDPTHGQLDQWARFKEAARSAKAALADPLMRAFYETVAEGE